MRGCWHCSVKTCFHSLLKFRVILTVITLLNPIMTDKLPYRPPMLREGIKLKKFLYIKKVIYWILITIYSIK